MESELKKIPVYARWLRGAHGIGVVTAAYLLADIDIHKATKPSSLVQFCGLAIINGQLERLTKGVERRYNLSLRTRLFLTFPASMWKLGGAYTCCETHKESKPKANNAAAKETFRAQCRACIECKKTERPNGTTNKYLKIWKDKKHGLLWSERVDRHGTGDIVKWTVAMGAKNVSARSWAHSASWHVAARVFLEDLYIVWRALEGLPVWPDYHAAKLGYSHGGKICVKEPKTMSAEEAISVVGDVGAHPLAVDEPAEDPAEDIDLVTGDIDLDEELTTDHLASA